ncbi:hypothetical protein HDU99_009039, partial [Rhizoclosmatium hyalinum]
DVPVVKAKPVVEAPKRWGNKTVNSKAAPPPPPPAESESASSSSTEEEESYPRRKPSEKTPPSLSRSQTPATTADISPEKRKAPSPVKLSPPPTPANGFLGSMWSGKGAKPAAGKSNQQQQDSPGSIRNSIISIASRASSAVSDSVGSLVARDQPVASTTPNGSTETTATANAPEKKRGVLGWIFGGKKNAAATAATPSEPTPTATPQAPAEPEGPKIFGKANIESVIDPRYSVVSAASTRLSVAIGSRSRKPKGDDDDGDDTEEEEEEEEEEDTEDESVMESVPEPVVKRRPPPPRVDTQRGDSRTRDLSAPRQGVKRSDRSHERVDASRQERSRGGDRSMDRSRDRRDRRVGSDSEARRYDGRKGGVQQRDRRRSSFDSVY